MFMQYDLCSYNNKKKILWYFIDITFKHFLGLFPAVAFCFKNLKLTCYDDVKYARELLFSNFVGRRAQQRAVI